LAAGDLFEDGFHHPVLSNFAEKLVRSSEWNQQSVSMEQLGNIVASRVSKPDPFLADLIRGMTGEPDKRPTPIEALDHPLFWAGERWLAVVKQWDDLLQQWTARMPDRIREFEREQRAIVGENWLRMLHPALVADATKYRTYSGTITDLIMLIRNKSVHEAEDPNGELATVIGKGPERFFSYFHRTFPKLFLYVYYFVKRFERS
jgi:hypothetical protein